MRFSTFAVLAGSLASATPFNPRPFDEVLRRRQASSNSSSLQVDLGYAVYEGFYNDTHNVNEWMGIRYAAPPIGSLRWQAPQAPLVNRSSVINASAIPNECPQSALNSGNQQAAITTINAPGGSEDCLYLSVYSPPNSQNLPVLVWIHGGGYGEGNGGQDLGPIIGTNNGSFVGVAIQYRLGAFGFLSSDEVFQMGVANAGIRDQTFALQWVQSYIHLFGGNASQVTISGESAGGGSVMLQTMAYGGTLGTSLFSNAIAASPYLPMQYNYNAWVPSQSYYAFAQAAGCLSGFAAGSPAVNTTIFQCLVGKDTAVLKNASAAISASGMYGTWGFLPVTDGVFIQQLPSQQLAKKQVNGLRMLAGNNALEGPLFVPQNVTTEIDLVTWIQETFPMFTTDDISKVLQYYPGSNATDSTNAVEYATLGYTGATANNESSISTGQQQRANNIYAETTFVCPSYWLAEAFANKGREAYKYQYSVPAALHGSDVSAYFGPGSVTQGPDFVKAFMTIWGNFITLNDPSISSSIAAGNSSNSSTTPNPITNWPAYTNANPYQINLNETGGTEFTTAGVDFEGTEVNVTEYMGPGLRNNFSLVNAWTWEGNRGIRCDFWRAMGGLVPE
ncbi:carboxylesterase type B [Mollisia scopiformis]|uniref:Carboxylic ester hydrolase n=1 Tax=Mollisia scopiformis TaxID=149040 RepID=A0A194XKY2_MOLSC|nr:carboxylesterase type B [Mollisia scopiformis]KUJ20432.1 carboxylesterase type B [Mollisia scopiformis]